MVLEVECGNGECAGNDIARDPEVEAPQQDQQRLAYRCQPDKRGEKQNRPGALPAPETRQGDIAIDEHRSEGEDLKDRIPCLYLAHPVPDRDLMITGRLIEPRPVDRVRYGRYVECLGLSLMASDGAPVAPVLLD